MELPKEIKPGNQVKITLDKESITGILLPRSELYADDCISLKLSTGYNMGIAKAKIKSIEKIGDGTNLAERKEVQAKQNKKLPKIGIVAIGGTVSDRIDYTTGGVSHNTSAEQLLSMCPQAFDIVCVEGVKSSFQKDSSEITIDNWKTLARDIYSFVQDDKIAGVLVLMGTDSLHYTSAAMSFMLRNLNKPVVFTYSARSSDRASSDAFLNIDAAIRMTVSQIPSVLVVGHATSHDTVCQALRGTTVRKMHASRRDTFRPINDGPIATIENGQVKILQHIPKPTGNPMLNDQFEKKVAFIQYVPGLDPEILDYYQKQGYTGAVISMLGLGQIAASDSDNNWVPFIKKAIDSGMIICATAQTIYGALQPHVYAPGRLLSQTGVIHLGGMTSETAYVKLGCALGRWSNKKQIEEFMLTNIAGEMQDFQDYQHYMN